MGNSMDTYTVSKSDLLKVRDAIIEACDFFEARDKMNSHIHLAHQVRFSPITTTMFNARDRIRDLLLEGPQEEELRG